MIRNGARDAWLALALALKRTWPAALLVVTRRRLLDLARVAAEPRVARARERRRVRSVDVARPSAVARARSRGRAQAAAMPDARRGGVGAPDEADVSTRGRRARHCVRRGRRRAVARARR